MKNHLAWSFGVALAAWAAGSSAWANGYQLDIQSVRAQGAANAGSIEAADPSTLFYNPAGLTRLSGTQSTLSLIGVDPHERFTEGSATNGSGLPVSPASNGGNFAQSVLLPSLYGSHQVNDRLTIGLGIFAPYGTMLKYSDDFAGRYYGRALNLRTVTVNPSIGIRLNARHSIGFGLDVQYMEATLGKNQDLAPVSYATCVASGAAPAQCQSVASAYLTQQDARVRINGNDWGYGFNVGYLYTPDTHTRIGLAYRSAIREHLKGTAVFTIASSLPGGSLSAIDAGIRVALADSAGTVDITTPETVSLQLFRDVDPRWAIMGDLTWTRQSRLQDIAINMPTSALPERSIDYRIKWRDTWRASVGASFKVNDTLVVRGGYAYDRTPVSDARYALTIMPDGNRNMLSFGGTYRLGDRDTIDFAYSLIVFQRASINRSDDDGNPANGSPGTLTGTYHDGGHVNLLGLSFTHQY